jgi:glycosyltransferase involved in cell wall biosynthesis
MKISVVVPVWNEARAITALLDGLLAQTRPPDEIVVADNGSTDSTPAIVERYVKNRRPVRLVRGGRGLPGRGRNRGVAAARHDWIAFIDAGTLPEPDWLDQLAAQAEQNPHAEAIYGAFRPVTDTLFTECAAMAYLTPPQEIDGVLARTRSTASLMLRRELWKKAGGFPEHLRSAEDLVFLGKIEAAEARIAQAPRAVVHWELQPNLFRTFLRFVQYSRHNIRAGLWRNWQAPIFKRYALLVLAAAPAYFLPWWWLVVLALWAGLLALRAAVTMRRNRVAYPAGNGRNLLRFLVLIPLLGTLDAAALIGSLNWLLWDKLQLMGGVDDAP